MVNWAELAHGRHTDQSSLSDQIEERIEEHRLLIDSLIRLRSVNPLPPQVPSPSGQMQSALHDYGAVQYPFNPIFMLAVGAEPQTNTEAKMVEWRRQLREAMRNLRECVWLPNNDSFAFLKYPHGFFVAKDASDTINALQMQLELLFCLFREKDPKQAMRYVLSQDVPGILKAARKKMNHSNEKAAEFMRVSVDAVKAWQYKKRTPDPDSYRSVENYILRAFALTDR